MICLVLLLLWSCEPLGEAYDAIEQADRDFVVAREMLDQFQRVDLGMVLRSEWGYEERQEVARLRRVRRALRHLREEAAVGYNALAKRMLFLCGLPDQVAIEPPCDMDTGLNFRPYVNCF